MESEQSYLRRFEQVKCIVCTMAIEIKDIDRVRKLFDQYEGSGAIVSINIQKKKERIFVNFDTRANALFCLSNIPNEGTIKDSHGFPAMYGQMYNPVLMELSFFDPKHKLRKILKKRSIKNTTFDIESIVNENNHTMYKTKISFVDLGIIEPRVYCHNTGNSVNLAVRKATQILRDHFIIVDRMKNKSKMTNVQVELPTKFTDTEHLRYTSVYSGDTIRPSRGCLNSPSVVDHHQEADDSDHFYSSDSDISSDDDDSSGNSEANEQEKEEHKGSVDGDKKWRYNVASGSKLPTNCVASSSSSGARRASLVNTNANATDNENKNAKQTVRYSHKKKCNSPQKNNEEQEHQSYLKYKAMREKEMGLTSERPENISRDIDSQKTKQAGESSSKDPVQSTSNGLGNTSLVNRQQASTSKYNHPASSQVSPKSIINSQTERDEIARQNAEFLKGHSLVAQRIYMDYARWDMEMRRTIEETRANTKEQIKISGIQENPRRMQTSNTTSRNNAAKASNKKTNLWMDKGKFRGFDPTKSGNSIKEFVPRSNRNESSTASTSTATTLQQSSSGSQRVTNAEPRTPYIAPAAAPTTSVQPSMCVNVGSPNLARATDLRRMQGNPRYIVTSPMIRNTAGTYDQRQQQPTSSQTASPRDSYRYGERRPEPANKNGRTEHRGRHGY